MDCFVANAHRNDEIAGLSDGNVLP